MYLSVAFPFHFGIPYITCHAILTFSCIPSKAKLKQKKWILAIHKTQRGFDLESNHGRTKEHFQGNKVTRCCKLQAFTSRSRAHKHLHNLLGPTDVANEDFEAIFLPTGVHKLKHKMFHFHDSVTTPYHSNANSVGSAGRLNIVYTYHIMLSQI